MKVWLLSGIPGSGKSTFAKKALKPEDKWISRDAVRFSMVSEDEEYFSREHEVFEMFIEKIILAIKTGMGDVWIDATHLNTKSRYKTMHWLEDLRDEYIDEMNCICFDVPLSVAFERNEQRSGRERVPRSVIRRMNCCFSFPTNQENFDHVYCVDEFGNMKEVGLHE